MAELTTLIILFFSLALDESDDTRELLRAIRRGDHDAFRTFFEKHHKHLYHFLLKRGMSEQAAEDIIQQAFVIIWEKRNEIDETKSLRAYLFRIAYTRMLNHFRDHKKFSDQAEFDQPGTQTPEATLEQKELKKHIDKAILEMPEKRQTAFRLCYLQGFSYKEAAVTMNISEKTVENHMGLAFKDLRRALHSLRT